MREEIREETREETFEDGLSAFQSKIVSTVKITYTWQIMKAWRPARNGQFYICRGGLASPAEYLYPNGYISTCCWVTDEHHGWYESFKDACIALDKIYPGASRSFTGNSSLSKK